MEDTTKSLHQESTSENPLGLVDTTVRKNVLVPIASFCKQLMLGEGEPGCMLMSGERGEGELVANLPRSILSCADTTPAVAGWLCPSS